MIVAVLLVRESKGLLTGEAADPAMRRGIRAILESDRDVGRVNPPLTMYFGPDTVLLAVEIQFRSGLTAGDVVKAVDRLEGKIREAHPKVKRIFIEAESIRAEAA
jgi:divalent metal cation (Fe/Co/Zn/Cd) transporter